MLRVRAHGVLADNKTLRDGGDAVAPRDEFHDLGFALGKAVFPLQLQALLRYAVANDPGIFGSGRPAAATFFRLRRRGRRHASLASQKLDRLGRHRAARYKRPEKRARRSEKRDTEHEARYHGHEEQPFALADRNEIAHPPQKEPDAVHDVDHTAEEPVHKDRIHAAVARNLSALHHHEHLHEREYHIRRRREQI